MCIFPLRDGKWCDYKKFLTCIVWKKENWQSIGTAPCGLTIWSAIIQTVSLIGDKIYFRFATKNRQRCESETVSFLQQQKTPKNRAFL